jgi:acetyl-CoA synthetase
MSESIRSADLIKLGTSEADAEGLIRALDSMAGIPPSEAWRLLASEHLTPTQPFAVHRLLFDRVYAGWDESKGPRPAWVPDPKQVGASNIGRMMSDLGFDEYQDFHAWSVRERDVFWSSMIDRLGIRFAKPFRQVREPTSPHEAAVWLPDAHLNIAESCFQADPEATAVIHPAPDGSVARQTYGELDSLSARVAGGLVKSGFVPGDSLAVILPMTKESVAIYLGIVRVGCVVVSISDSFAAGEIATRLRLTGAKAVFTQDIMLRAGKRISLLERIVQAGGPRAIVLPGDPSGFAASLRPEDWTWEQFLAAPACPAVVAEPGSPTNWLFSSGTTGEPKVIPWTHTTPIKCAADAWLHHDIRPGDVLAWPTNLGWMMGPWLIYAALINRGTIALYPDVPTTREFGLFIQEAKVTLLGLVPSLVRAWRESGCMEGLDWSRIKAFSSTGECSNPEDMLYLMRLGGYKPVIEYCGGTEIGGSYLTGTVVQPSSPATFSTPALGLDFDLVDENGKPARSGEVLLKPPSIGLSNDLLNTDHFEVYHADVPTASDGSTRRRHGDEVEALGGGYFRHHGRADDTMNLGGIKVSSVEIERVLRQADHVHETAAIAVPPSGGGPDQLVIYLVPASDSKEESADIWRERLQSTIRQRLNPLFRISHVVIVDSLPRTASNKVMRRELRADYHKMLANSSKTETSPKSKMINGDDDDDDEDTDDN